MRLNTGTTAAVGCDADARRGCTRRDGWPVGGLGTTVVAAVEVWDVRPSGAAV